MGAPVFALMGYAVASHVIPRGLLCRYVVWLGAKCAVWVIIAIGAPITQSHNSHNSHNSHIKRRPIDFANRSGYTEFGCKKSPQRYPTAMRFFLPSFFFTWKKKRLFFGFFGFFCFFGSVFVTLQFFFGGCAETCFDGDGFFLVNFFNFKLL